MDPQEALQRQKKSLEIAEFERKLFEEQAKDLEDAIEARREEMKHAGDQAQAKLQGRSYSAEASKEQDEIEQTQQIESEQQILIKQQINEDLNREDQGNRLKEQSIALAKGLLHSAGYKMEDHEVEKLNDKPLQKSEFPTGMIFLAITKDILDILLTLTGVGIIIVVLYSFFYFVASVSWTLSRANRLGLFKKFIVKKALNRMLLAYAAEIIPGLDVLPLATVFVLLNNYSETKFVKVLIEAAEIVTEGHTSIK